MLNKKLTEELIALTPEQWQEVLNVREISLITRANHLVNLMSKVLGEPYEYDLKTTKMSWARAMLCAQLKAEGMKLTDVAKVMRLTLTPTRLAMEKIERMKLYPKMYFDVIPIWNKFQSMVENENDRRADKKA